MNKKNKLKIFAFILSGISDHGDGISRHHWNQKWSLYDESAKVPFIVAQKGATAARKVDQHLISSGLDLLPTICDYAGVKVPESCLGRSVRQLAEGKVLEKWRTYVASETGFGTWAKVGDDNWAKARMVKTEQYKYIVFDQGKVREQLIDMKNDPGEMVNLDNNDEYRKILENHRNYLIDWCRRTNDSFRYIQISK